MSANDINSDIMGHVGTTASSYSWFDRIVVPVAVTLLGAAAWAVDPAGGLPTETPVRLAAVTVPASYQGGCGSDMTLMAVSQTLRMIAPPVAASDVQAADRNGDRRVCVKMPRGGGSPTHFEDNWYEPRGNGGCGGSGMGGAKGDMNGGCGGDMDGEEGDEDGRGEHDEPSNEHEHENGVPGGNGSS